MLTWWPLRHCLSKTLQGTELVTFHKLILVLEIRPYGGMTCVAWTGEINYLFTSLYFLNYVHFCFHCEDLSLLSTTTCITNAFTVKTSLMGHTKIRNNTDFVKRTSTLMNNATWVTYYCLHLSAFCATLPPPRGGLQIKPYTQNYNFRAYYSYWKFTTLLFICTSLCTQIIGGKNWHLIKYYSKMLSTADTC